jgi:hypothetical protein
MQYILLIYGNEELARKASPDEQGKVYGEYIAFTKSVRESGQLRAGEPLESVAKAKSVRVREGKTAIIDGPFAETKEQLGGFYVIEAKNDAEACEIASRLPTAKTGTIEVRPIMKLPGM